MKKKSIKLAASLFSICICASSVLTTGVFNGKISLISTISASAATYREGDYKYSVIDQGNNVIVAITAYYGNATSLVIPTKLGGYYVNSIHGSAFDGTPVENISFASDSRICPNGVFGGIPNMKKLKTITLPSNCTEIDENAFYGCPNLTTVNYGSSMKKIGEYAFKNCSSLKNITLNEGTEIGAYAFENCSSLISVRFPKGSIVHNRAFSNSGLTNIIIPTNFQDTDLKKFDPDAFSNCTNLDHINYTIPYTVSSYTSKPVLYQPLEKYSIALFMHSDTVKWVDDYINYLTSYVVKSIRNQDPFISDVQMAKKLNDWICDNTVYADDLDPNGYNYQHYYTVFLGGKGVCAGYAAAYGKLLTKAGLSNSDCVQGKHVWNRVKLNDECFNIDTTWNDNTNSYQYFMESDTERIKSTGYAKWKGYGQCVTPMGDLNGDKKVDNTDVQKLRKYLLGYSNQISSTYAYLADMDFDGSITSYDLIKLQRKANNQ